MPGAVDHELRAFKRDFVRQLTDQPLQSSDVVDVPDFLLTSRMRSLPARPPGRGLRRSCWCPAAGHSPPGTQEALAELDPDTVLVAGGPAAVADAVLTQLAPSRTGPTE